MNYRTTSVKPVIAKIIRNTGKNMPSEYLDDILEWIPEAIKLLKTYTTVQPLDTKVTIEGHIGALPCGLLSIKGVEYKGSRLREGGDIRDVTKNEDILSIGNGQLEVWETETTPKDYDEAFPDNSYTEERRGEDIVRTGSELYADYYQLVPNYIQTSFEEGEVRIIGTKLPLDDEGYPMVPDNENYRTAVYWYVLMMGIGSGYKHPLFQYTDCETRWEKFARRAINEVKYPNPDRMARIEQAYIRLVPPTHFYEDFRSGSEQVQEIRGL
jgi:hypothetical protein